MKKTYYSPTLGRLEDRILLNSGPLSAALHSLVEPPASDCVEMRTMEQSHHSMEILMSPEHCCSSELMVHIEDTRIVVHLPPALEGRIVRIEGRSVAVSVGHDGHVHLPFAESAGTVTLTITNHEGEDIPFLRVTHDGHGTIMNYHCLVDLHTLMEKHEENHVHPPHATHEQHLSHPLHEEHAEHPHAPHVPHTEHKEKHEDHEPHVPHEEHKDPLEEHGPMEEDSIHQGQRPMDQRERDDRALLEEAFDWGSWWEEEPITNPPALENNETTTEHQGTTSHTPEFWPIIGSATVAAAALAGAYALERRARRKGEEQG